jgi:RP/EB family microtubule-associated protein
MHAGIMEGLYFTGRKELLEWLNSFLELEYTKVEQVASAAAFCQLMDALHPGTAHLASSHH